jgi:hypothetical protein
MQRLGLGEPLHPRTTGFEEGFHYNYTFGGHTIILSVLSPTGAEIKAVRSGRWKFALSATDEAIFFLLRFGDDPWHAADYNWWINPPVMRPDPLADLAELKASLPISVCLVDAAGGRVAALRMIRLPVEFGTVLLTLVERQTHRGFDSCRYLDLVQEAKKGFIEGRAGVPEVLCACSQEWEFMPLLTTPMPHVLQ